MSWRLIATGAAAVGSGVVGGVLFGFSAFVMPALRRTVPVSGIDAMQSINREAPKFAFMSVVAATAVVSIGLGVHALLDRDAPGTWWVVGGTGAYLAAIVVTGAINVPRNERLAAVDASTPEGADYWSTFVRQWVVANHVRTGCCIAAAASFAVALQRG